MSINTTVNTATNTNGHQSERLQADDRLTSHQVRTVTRPSLAASFVSQLGRKGLHSDTFTTLLTFCAWFSILGLTFSVVKAEVPSAPINSDVVAAAKTISCSSNGYVRQMIKSSTFTGRGA